MELSSTKELTYIICFVLVRSNAGVLQCEPETTKLNYVLDYRTNKKWAGGFFTCWLMPSEFFFVFGLIPNL